MLFAVAYVDMPIRIVGAAHKWVTFSRVDRRVDFFRQHFAQADMGAAHGGDAPGKAPAVTMKHGKRPQIGRCGIKADFQHFSQRIQISAPVMVHDAFGKSGGAARVVDGHELIFVIDIRNDRLRRACSQKFFIFHAGQRFVAADIADIHKCFYLLQFADDR